MATKKKKSSVRAPAARDKNPLAAEIAGRWGRAGETTSIERIASELDDVPRYDIVAALKQLEKAGQGEFSVGHGGHRARFVWAASLPRSRQEARPRRPGAALPVRGGTRADKATKGQSPGKPGGSRRTVLAGGVPDGPQPSRGKATLDSPELVERTAVLEHRFHLRPGFVTSLQLPVDVTRLEVERICQFLQAIPFVSEDEGPER
jgi:hypothetical protein